VGVGRLPHDRYADSIDYWSRTATARTVEIPDAETRGSRMAERAGGAQMPDRPWRTPAGFTRRLMRDYRGRPEEFVRAMRAVSRETRAVMGVRRQQSSSTVWPLFSRCSSRPRSPIDGRD